MQNKISRRQFLQVTGASVAALLLAGLPVEVSAASGHLTVISKCQEYFPPVQNRCFQSLL